MTTIQFQFNEPQVFSLKDPCGDSHQGQIVHQVSDGRVLVLPAHAAEKLEALALEAGDEISICRYREGNRPAEWVIALTPRTEKKRAASELEQQLEKSLEAVQRKGVMPSAGPSGTAPVNRGAIRELKPTGTDDSPAPLRKPAPVAKASRGDLPPRVSYRVALADITKAVTGLLRETGEQWNDQAKQDAICTIFISAAKAGGVIFDFPEHAV